jgi:hypothetical protein
MASSPHCTLNHQIDQQNELIVHSYRLMFLLVFLQLVLNQALEQAGYTKDSALTTEDFSKVCFVAIKNCFLSTTFSVQCANINPQLPLCSWLAPSEGHVDAQLAIWGSNISVRICPYP